MTLSCQNDQLSDLFVPHSPATIIIITHTHHFTSFLLHQSPCYDPVCPAIAISVALSVSGKNQVACGANLTNNVPHRDVRLDVVGAACKWNLCDLSSMRHKNEQRKHLISPLMTDPGLGLMRDRQSERERKKEKRSEREIESGSSLRVKNRIHLLFNSASWAVVTNDDEAA